LGGEADRGFLRVPGQSNRPGGTTEVFSPGDKKPTNNQTKKILRLFLKKKFHYPAGFFPCQKQKILC